MEAAILRVRDRSFPLSPAHLAMACFWLEPALLLGHHLQTEHGDMTSEIALGGGVDICCVRVGVDMSVEMANNG